MPLLPDATGLLWLALLWLLAADLPSLTAEEAALLLAVGQQP